MHFCVRGGKTKRSHECERYAKKCVRHVEPKALYRKLDRRDPLTSASRVRRRAGAALLRTTRSTVDSRSIPSRDGYGAVFETSRLMSPVPALLHGKLDR